MQSLRKMSNEEQQLLLLESCGILWSHEISNPERHSFFTRSKSSESTGDDEESELDEEEPRRRKRSSSLSNSPYHPSGIPLGSKAAQEAAKSFWNMDMFQERLQKIAKYTANDQVSGLGSSLESVDTQVDEPEEEQKDQELKGKFVGVSPIAPYLKHLPFSLTSASAPTSPTHSPPLSIQRSRSACSESPSKQASVSNTENVSRKVSPYLSPRSLKRVHFELNQRLDSASAPHLSVVGQRLRLIPRLSHNSSHDDGYHDS